RHHRCRSWGPHQSPEPRQIVENHKCFEGGRDRYKDNEVDRKSAPRLEPRVTPAPGDVQDAAISQFILVLGCTSGTLRIIHTPHEKMTPATITGPSRSEQEAPPRAGSAGSPAVPESQR